MNNSCIKCDSNLYIKHFEIVHSWASQEADLKLYLFVHEVNVMHKVIFRCNGKIKLDKNIHENPLKNKLHLWELHFITFRNNNGRPNNARLMYQQDIFSSLHFTTNPLNLKKLSEQNKNYKYIILMDKYNCSRLYNNIGL